MPKEKSKKITSKRIVEKKCARQCGIYIVLLFSPTKFDVLQTFKLFSKDNMVNRLDREVQFMNETQMFLIFTMPWIFNQPEKIKIGEILWALNSIPECDEYIRIFEYSNILVTNIYSDIRSYQFFFYEYIWTFVRVKFVCTNIFGHSLVSVLECKT